MKLSILLLITLNVVWLNSAQEGTGYLFRKEIVGLAFPYYKLRLSLGDCMDELAFKEIKAYAGLGLNRLLDIYYKSDDLHQKVFQVDVTLITNNTNCIAFSNIGLGYSEFRGTVVIPNNIALFIYTLEIYVCWDNSTDISITEFVTETTDSTTDDDSFSNTEEPMERHAYYKPWMQRWKEYFSAH